VRRFMMSVLLAVLGVPAVGCGRSCSTAELVGTYTLTHASNLYLLDLREKGEGVIRSPSEEVSIGWEFIEHENAVSLHGDNRAFHIFSKLVSPGVRVSQLDGVLSGYFLLTASCTSHKKELIVDDELGVVFKSEESNRKQ